MTMNMEYGERRRGQSGGNTPAYPEYKVKGVGILKRAMKAIIMHMNIDI